MVVGVDMVGTINTEYDILKTLQKGISHLSTRSGITMKKNKGKWQRFTK